MSSTKGLKEKSSTTKFWKKFSLSKKSSVTLPEQQHSSPAVNDVDDDRSVKSKRMSGFLPHKRQSIGSLRKRQSSSNNQVCHEPPAVPDNTVLHVAGQQQRHQHQQQQQVLSSQQSPPSLTDASAATVALSAKEHHHHVIPTTLGQAPHDLGSTAAATTSPAPLVADANATTTTTPDELLDDKKQRGESEQVATPTAAVETNSVVSRFKSPDSRSTRPRYNSNTTKPSSASRLAAPSTIPKKSSSSMISSSSSSSGGGSAKALAHVSSTDRLPRPTPNKSTQSTHSSSSGSSSLSPTSSPSSSSRTTNNNNNNNTRNNNNVTSPSPSSSSKAAVGSRLRKPSQIPGKSTLPQLRSSGQETSPSKANKNDSNTPLAVKKKKSTTSIASKDATATMGIKSTTELDKSSSSDPALVIKQLREELEKERSVVKVLQGQKEAVSKDLDYFSQMMDDLMEEKELLQQKYDEEKENNKHREEDLNELLNKLRSSNDNARDRSFEADQWKTDLEKIQNETREEQEGLRTQLKSKNKEIQRLKSELSQANDQIQTLKTTMDQLVKKSQYTGSKDSSDHHHSINNSPQPIETPTASPNIQHANIPKEYAVQDNNNNVPQSPIPSSHHHHHHHFNNSSMPPSPTRTSTQSGSIPINNNLYDDDYENTPHSSFNSEAAPHTSKDDLDRQLLKLTKEKEKLQSDYSKIPISGGGPMSRRRKEELEDMLDEVDSQLSKVKQKIRRS